MADTTHNPAADILEPVRCNQCMWQGDEADLVLAHDAEDGELTNAACPMCLTDHYLMDFPEVAA